MRCIICDKEMESNTSGNYYCSNCGRNYNDMVYRPSEWKPFPHEGFGEQRGWICPVCGRGVAPWVDYCPCQIDRGITFATGTGTYINLDLKEFEKYATTNCEELKL